MEAAPSQAVVLARENFGAFCIAMGKPPAPHMLEWHRELLTGESNDHLQGVAGPNTCLLSPRGPLDLDTPVATRKGWQPLRAIKKGDYVYDSTGALTRVIDVMRYGEVECWRVELSDGTSVVCDDTHGWDVSRGPRKEGQDWVRVPLNRLRTEITTALPAPPGDPRKFIRPRRTAAPGEKPWIRANGTPRWHVCTADPVQYPEADLPIDPYLMGVLLARSSLLQRIWLTAKDPDILDRIRQSLPEGCSLHSVRGAVETYSIVHSPAEKGAREAGTPWRRRRTLSINPIIPPLEELELLDRPKAIRQIPGLYLNSSIPQRMALLQGLMDSAGRNGKGGVIIYECSSPLLFEGVLELIRSLGGIAREVAGNRGLLNRRLVARLPRIIEPFYCDAKSGRYASAVSRRRGAVASRTIVDIRPIGTREVGCITVESPLHDFLIKDYVVSCNSAKSTEVGLLCAWLIGRHTLARKLLRILYVSFIIDVARGKSQAIKNTILSSDYQEIFPMVRISKAQTSNELWSIDFEFAGIDVRGEDAFTLACAGLRGAITSKRSNLVVLDDLIKSRKSIENPEVRREMESNWKSVIVPTMFQGARAVALGTRFHWDDILATTFNEKNGWKVLIQGALVYDDDGTVRSYWPDMWSLKYLLDLQQKDPVAFAYQYMNRAVRSEELGLSYDLFVRGDVPDSFDEIGVGIDLSSGLSEKNDYTVFILGGRDGDKAYIIDMRRMRCMGNIEKVEALCDLLHEWNLLGRDENGRYSPTASPVSIWPEDVAYQKSFEGDFRRKAFEEWGLENLRVSPDKRGGTKGDLLARFRGVIGLFETRKVVFNRYRDFQVVFDEIANLGNAPHDDCVSAIQILLKRLFGRGQVQIDWRD